MESMAQKLIFIGMLANVLQFIYSVCYLAYLAYLLAFQRYLVRTEILSTFCTQV